MNSGKRKRKRTEKTDLILFYSDNWRVKMIPPLLMSVSINCRANGVLKGKQIIW